jgi:hypothetical protein
MIIMAEMADAEPRLQLAGHRSRVGQTAYEFESH